VYRFIRSGALGKAIMARAQWHERDSWERTSPNADRMRALNWRIRSETSPGLLGEVGIQQLDTAMWIFDARPTTVTGFGGVYYWEGRDVADTAQAVFDFPGGERLFYDATLVSSFDAMYDSFYGSDSTIILRDQKAWMFKEVDAPLLGWEVYARKDKFYKETGVALVANATKIEAAGLDPTADDPNAETPLFHALKAFMDNYFFGPFEPVMNYQKSFEATVVALKANEAVQNNSRIEYDPSWFVV
jgi:predicted dehydrogenase